MNDLEIGWIAREYMGQEIMNLSKEKLTKKEDLIADEEILIPSLTGIVKAKVVKKEEQTYAESDNFLFILEFDIDDRHCWVCSGIVNKKCLEKYNF